MPGPLPTGEAARRNKPAIPSSQLLATGRTDPAPECPVELGDQGATWWEWAWHTPQALGWSDGDLYFIGHRAQLEDDVHALDAEDFSILDEVLSYPEDNADALVGRLINRLKGMVTGKASLLTRINDMDDKLGLTPKGLAALRWKIVPAEDEAMPAASTGRNLRSSTRPADVRPG